MSWVKRNLYFVVSSVIAMALLVVALLYGLSKYKLNEDNRASLNEAYGKLSELINKDPNPGNETVDNIAAAAEQRKQILAVIDKARKHFAPIPSIPDLPHVTKSDFSAALPRTISELQHAAAAAAVTLGQPDYAFSFTQQRYQITFAESSLPPLARQLGEVKAICGVLFGAKVNSLEYIRRERACDEDLKGQATDYVEEKSTTNELAILTPYEVCFDCFSPDLAEVLTGFGTSSNGFVVRTINVIPATLSLADAAMPATETMTAPTPTPTFSDSYAAGRFGGRFQGANAQPQTPPPQGGWYRPPTVQDAPPVAPAGATRNGLPVMLNERQLRVTMTVMLVRLLPNK